MRTAGVGPLPTRLLSFTVADGELVPAWLSERDRPWLRDLLLDAEAFVGKPIGELTARWRHGDPDPRAGRRHGIATHVLSTWLRRAAGRRPMTVMRQELFQLAAQGVQRDEALSAVASRHDLGTRELADHLFADLPDNRPVRWPEPRPEPSQLAWSANRALIQGMLLHAGSAEIALRGAARAIMRTVWLLGGSLKVTGTSPRGVAITWHGGDSPSSARTLAAVVPLLPWADRYLLRATCEVRGERGLVVLSTGDPILPGPEPQLYDSALERRFAREFAALAPRWQLLREPVPIAIDDGLAFPDFELRRRDGSSRWLCEIAGLRDLAALPRKLALLAAHKRLLLCLPRRHVPEPLRDHPRIVAFDRFVDPRLVLAAIDDDTD